MAFAKKKKIESRAFVAHSQTSSSFREFGLFFRLLNLKEYILWHKQDTRPDVFLKNSNKKGLRNKVLGFLEV